MIDTKSLFSSKGVWGALGAIAFALLPSALKAAHIDGVIAPQDVVDLVSQFGTAAAGALALYGRIKATKRID